MGCKRGTKHISIETPSPPYPATTSRKNCEEEIWDNAKDKFKGEQNRRSIEGPKVRNGKQKPNSHAAVFHLIPRPVYENLTFEICKHVTLLPFFCSAVSRLLTRSSNLVQKKVLLLHNHWKSDQMIISMQIKMFPRLLHFYANLCLRFGSPLSM